MQSGQIRVIPVAGNSFVDVFKKKMMRKAPNLSKLRLFKWCGIGAKGVAIVVGHLGFWKSKTRLCFLIEINSSNLNDFTPTFFSKLSTFQAVSASLYFYTPNFKIFLIFEKRCSFRENDTSSLNLTYSCNYFLNRIYRI